MGRKKNMGDKRERGTTKNFRCQLKWKDKEEGERGTNINGELN